jgi:hypothetical protein
VGQYVDSVISRRRFQQLASGHKDLGSGQYSDVGRVT